MRRALFFAVTSALTLAFLASHLTGTSIALRQPTTVPAAVTPTFDASRLAQPPTVYPPAQADTGAQIYWGMCLSCHGDKGQGLTEDWLNSFPPEERNCWDSGCHASDAPANSFELPQTGVPALAGAGALSRFSNSFQVYRYILENMPFSRAGSLTSEEAWALTAYILRLNDREIPGFTLDKTSGAAVSVHHQVTQPASPIPGGLLLAGILILAAGGLNAYAKRNPPPGKPNFIHHLHPPTIPAAQSRLRYTLGAGGMAVFLSLVLFATGLLEMYYYVPTPESAAVSVQTIAHLAPFGGLVRNLHFWAAQFLVIVMSVHLLRVVLTGAYAPPRRFNHVLGAALLAFILLLDFTGYVLRWDEGVHWALVVGANMLKTVPLIGNGLYRFVIGGNEPGGATLIRFYAWHIFGLTTGAVILTVWHIFRVRRDGGIAVPPPSERKDEERITRFDLLRREVLAMTAAAAFLLLFSLIFPAPLDQPIETFNMMAGGSTAPWFFLWIQYLLKFGDPFVMGILIPILVVITLGALPYVLPNAKSGELGRWFPRGNRIAQAAAVSIMFLILLLTVLGAIPN
jgi:quinol-cytochrome oxidoreductase complex cytochrome b subunit/mono/diheme cytochrome c family protein